MIHLHWHSHFSLFEWYWSPKKIIEKAKNLWMTSIAITDYYNMYWAIEFFENAKKNDIKPIIWVEIPFSESNKTSKPTFLVILAKNFSWYKNLLKIVSEANLKNYQNFPKINSEILKKYKNDIIIILWGIKSIIWEMILNNEKIDKISEFIKKFENIVWKENILLEVQPQPGDDYKKINSIVIEMGNKLNYTIIINNNFHYINEENKTIRWVMQAIKNWDYFSPEKHIPNEIWHICSENEIINLWKKYLNLKENEIKKLIQNNKEIANTINIEIPLWNILFPKYKVSPEIEKLYKKYKNLLIEK